MSLLCLATHSCVKKNQATMPIRLLFEIWCLDDKLFKINWKFSSSLVY